MSARKGQGGAVNPDDLAADIQQEAGERHISTLDVARARVWELHLRGVPRRRIAEQVGINRQTVGAWLAAEWAGLEREGRRDRERTLEEAVARLRRTQEQAWEDHDADDERERAFIAEAKPGSRYQSQRAQYLRVIVDAEKEIARLLGLYDVGVMAAVAAAGVTSDGAGMAAVVFRIERVGASPVSGTGVGSGGGSEP